MPSTTYEIDPIRLPELLRERALSRVGTSVAGRWKLDGLLGMGGMASVYSAQHRTGRRVAVKILHPELAFLSDIVQRFLREGYAANAVKHPGTVAVLDDGVTDEGLPFLVMEFLEGESLDGRLERLGAPLALGDTLAIGAAALDVLAAAHGKGIVHRDIKPDNLFLTAEQGVKILDFGIARLADASSLTATRSGVAMGTPTFMPREQAHGDLALIGAQVDLWALGATLYYALSLRFLYDVVCPVEFLAQLVTRDPRPLLSVAPAVPGPIAAVIDRALQHDLAVRWSSAVEMKQALLDAARSCGVVVPARPSLAGFIASTVPRIRVRSRLVSLPEKPPPRPEVSEVLREFSADDPAIPQRRTLPVPAPSAPPEPPPTSGPGLIAAVLLFLALGGGAALLLRSREGKAPPAPVPALASVLPTASSAALAWVGAASASVSSVPPPPSASTAVHPRVEPKNEPKPAERPLPTAGGDLGATRQ